MVMKRGVYWFYRGGGGGVCAETREQACRERGDGRVLNV